MPVMVYTGYSASRFLLNVPEFKKLHGQVYLKHGAYDESKLLMDHYNYGVKLASSNQRIELVDALISQEYQQAI